MISEQELREAIELHVGGRSLGDLASAHRVDGVIPDVDDNGDSIDVRMTGWRFDDGRVAVLDEAERAWIQEPDVDVSQPPHLIAMQNGVVLLRARSTLGVLLSPSH